MGRILKVVGIVVGAVVVLFVAAIVAIGLLVDPNDYKDEITAAVARATGRELTLAGDLDLELFPTVRLAVGEAELANAAGFGEQPFARIARAELAVAVLPLLSRRIEVDQARLVGLELNLARDASGRNNWQDLGGGAAAPADAPTPPAGDGSGPSFALDAEEIEIESARVTWSDAATGSRWELTDFDLAAADFGPDRAFPLEMSFSLAGEAVAVNVAATTQATLSLAQNTYRLEDLEVEIDGTGEGWPGGGGEAELTVASFGANLDQETLALDGLELEALGITVRGNLAGSDLMTGLTLTGGVDIAEFDPRELLGAFDVTVETADPSVLNRASASAEFLYDPRQIALRNMRLALDDSTLTGRVGLEGEAVRYELAVDTINADRYLPPAAEGDAASEDEGSLDEVDLPLEVLRTIDAAGTLSFEQVQFVGVTLTGASLGLTARNGTAELVPRAMLYGGQYSGTVRLEAQAAAARATVQQRLENVDMLPLGRDLLDSEMVSGTGSLTLDLGTTGSNVGEMRRALGGDVTFTLRDGALEGFDLWYELRRVRAVTEGASAPVRPEGARRTPFSVVSATGAVENAILTNRDLTATLPFMSITGAGTANLLDDTIDFDLRATFVDSPTLQEDSSMARLAGQSLPLRVGGTIYEPAVSPDFAALVRERAREEVQQRVDQETSEVQERLDQERSEAQERLDQEREEVRDSVRDRLRGILDR